MASPATDAAADANAMMRLLPNSNGTDAGAPYHARLHDDGGSGGVPQLPVITDELIMAELDRMIIEGQQQSPSSATPPTAPLSFVLPPPPPPAAVVPYLDSAYDSASASSPVHIHVSSAPLGSEGGFAFGSTMTGDGGRRHGGASTHKPTTLVSGVHADSARLSSSSHQLQASSLPTSAAPSPTNTDSDWLTDLIAVVDDVLADEADSTESPTTEDTSAVLDTVVRLVTPTRTSEFPTVAGDTKILSLSVPDRPLLEYNINVSKRTPQEVANCQGCNREIVLMILHGNPKEISSEGDPAADGKNRPRRVPDITCRVCYEHLDPEVPTKIVLNVRHPLKKKKRKAVRGWNTRVWCEVCEHLIGYGGVRIDKGDHQWHDPSYVIECICASCIVDFAVCKSCVPASRARHTVPGEWRPRQLFDATKPSNQSCTLMHGLITGRLDPRFVTYSMPYLRSDGPTWDTSPSYHFSPLNIDPHAMHPAADRVNQIANTYLENRRSFIFERLALPFTMRKDPTKWNFDQWMSRFNYTTGVRNILLRGHHAPPANPRHVRRYVTFAYQNPALADSRGADGNLRVVGYALVEWYVDEGHIYFTDTLFRYYDIECPAGAMGLNSSCLMRIDQDVKTLGLREPEHIWFIYPRFLAPTEDQAHEQDDDEIEEVIVSTALQPIARYARRNGLDLEALSNLLSKELFDAVNPTELDVGCKLVMRWNDRRRLEKEFPFFR